MNISNLSTGRRCPVRRRLLGNRLRRRGIPRRVRGGRQLHRLDLEQCIDINIFQCNKSHRQLYHSLTKIYINGLKSGDATLFRYHIFQRLKMLPFAVQRTFCLLKWKDALYHLWNGGLWWRIGIDLRCSSWYMYSVESRLLATSGCLCEFHATSKREICTLEYTNFVLDFNDSAVRRKFGEFLHSSFEPPPVRKSRHNFVSRLSLVWVATCQTCRTSSTSSSSSFPWAQFAKEYRAQDR